MGDYQCVIEILVKLCERGTVTVSGVHATYARVLAWLHNLTDLCAKCVHRRHCKWLTPAVDFYLV